MSRQRLIAKLSSHFADELLVLSSPGFANIIAFQNSGTVGLKVVKDDEDDLESSVGKVAKRILKECKEITHDKSQYRRYIDTNLATDSVSVTLQDLLSSVSKKLDNSLPAILIGNIVTSVVTNHPTDLQIALGVLLRDSRKTVCHMHDYRVTCSYDELLRFKKSAAVDAATKLSQQGISDARHGLVQMVSDNFDADIYSPNGKLSTHSLAMIITQQVHGNQNRTDKAIRRLKKEDMSRPTVEEQLSDSSLYTGQKKPVMPYVPVGILHSSFQ